MLQSSEFQMSEFEQCLSEKVLWLNRLNSDQVIIENDTLRFMPNSKYSGFQDRSTYAIVLRINNLQDSKDEIVHISDKTFFQVLTCLI